MKQINRIALALLLVAATAVAQQVTPPPPAPPRQANLPQPVEKTLTTVRFIVFELSVPCLGASSDQDRSEADPAELSGRHRRRRDF